MKRKVLLFGIITTMSVFGITRIIAANYYGTVPSEKLLAQTDCYNWVTWEADADCDGVDDNEDMCPNLPGDAAHCGCPEELVSVTGPGQCEYITDPDDPNNCNDCQGVPVGGGILLLIGSALIYGATIRRRNNKLNLENNN
ncbi:MAG: hypothetical protein FWD66_02685 [Paludibacter sp.]|nr:hypothetical protein [Paludibacter sp.]